MVGATYPADRPWPWIVVLLALGLVIVDRLNKLPLVLSFLAAYFGLFTAIAFADARSVAEMFRDPFLQAALFLALLMLTDPPTSPNRTGDQVWFGVLAANAWLAGRRLWLRRQRPLRVTPPAGGVASGASV